VNRAHMCEHHSIQAWDRRTMKDFPDGAGRLSHL
jgi:hypothetical protein